MIGTLLNDRYHLQAELGRGGMGIVYRACDTLLERDVAVKVLAGTALDAESRARLLREAQAAAKLNHPHIVSVYDAGERDDEPFIVMELVEGESLREHRPEALEEILSIAQQVCDALEHAHAHGIIHRDLKPGNVLIAPDGSTKLVDFGIARSGASRVTAEGVIVGTVFYMAPEQALGEEIDRRVDLYALGVVLYELTTGQLPFIGDDPVAVIAQHLHAPLVPPRAKNPEIPPPLDALIVRLLSKAPQDRPASASDVRKVLEYVGAGADTPAAALGLGVEFPVLEAVPCPYRGLEPFEAEHAEFYFGREEMVERLVAVVKESDFAAVVGPSGCGKSSLVRAGLVTALREGALPGSQDWDVRTLRPGMDPLRSLALPLVTLLEPQITEVDHIAEARKLADHLRNETLAMADVAARLREKCPDLPCLVLIVDQFEELYTECQDDALRHSFIKSLLAAKEREIVVVLTLRADFYGRVLADRGLSEAVDAGLVNVLPMSEEELRATIEQPALKTGRSFESGLVERILRDVFGEPGNLPLLQFALTGLWEQQTAAGVLTHDGYESIGQVEGAIAQRAEAIYGELERRGQGEIVQRIFTRLTHYGQGEGTRRRATLDDLITPRTPRGEIEAAIVALADARLLVTGQGEPRAKPEAMAKPPAPETVTAEIAHEALIRGWARLRRWLDEDRAFGLWREKLAVARQIWEEAKSDEGSLLRGATLAEAEGWVEGRREDLNEAEQSFIDESLALREKIYRASRRRRNIVIGVALVVAIAMAILGIFSFDRWQEAEQQQQMVLARQLAAQAELMRARAGGSWNLAGVLAVESLRRHSDSTEALTVMYRVLEKLGRPVSRLQHDDQVVKVAFSPDGQWVTTASADGTARVWEAATGAELARLQHDDQVAKVAFSPDGQSVATASADRTARVWDAATGAELARLQHDDWVEAAVFSPDGQWVATASRDRTARVWDAATGAELARLQHDDWAEAAVFSPDGQWVATASLDGTARVWDVTTGGELARLQHDDKVVGVAFSPDGQWVATASWGGTARIWEVATGAELARMQHEGEVVEAVFSPDGQWVATASWDGTARMWDAATGAELARMQHDDAVRDVAFSPDGQWVATASRDGTSRVWDAATGAELARLQYTDQRHSIDYSATVSFHSVVFSPDGRWVATASWDAAARVWDAATGAQLVVLSHNGWVEEAVFSPDGQWVATVSLDGTARVREAVTGVELARLQHGTGVWGVAFSPDGQRVATASRDRTTRVWDAATGAELARLQHDDAVRDVAFSPDGQWVATASDDGTARVWDAATGVELARLQHDDDVWNVAFSPDGQWVATASEDYTARVWDAATGAELARLQHDDDVWNVAFSPDGQWVATASDDGTARVWRAPDNLVDALCSYLTRNLTRREWAYYLGDEPYERTCPNLPVPTD